MVLTFLTPRLPPCVCGVGDHTVHMADAMRDMVSSVTAIVLHSQPQRSGNVFDRIDRWNGRSAALAALLRDHATDLLWIQYSGYGFGYQGIPWFLIRAIKSLRQRPKIAIYFHEIHCSPHQLGWKGRLLSPLQKQLGKALANTADVIFTSNELYRQTIQRDYSVPSNRVALLPLGSNIPVPVVDERDRQRWREELGWDRHDCVAVCFGSVGGQRKVLRRNRDVLLAAIREGRVNRVVCIGGELSTRRDDVLLSIDDEIAEAATVMGHQSAENVAKILVAADVALMGYPFERFGKSGVFMSYALAGLPTVVSDGLPPDEVMFRGARLLHAQDLDQLGNAVSDIEARIARQQQAAEEFSWSSIAHSALDAVNSVCPPTGRSPLVMGALT